MFDEEAGRQVAVTFTLLASKDRRRFSSLYSGVGVQMVHSDKRSLLCDDAKRRKRERERRKSKVCVGCKVSAPRRKLGAVQYRPRAHCTLHSAPSLEEAVFPESDPSQDSSKFGEGCPDVNCQTNPACIGSGGVEKRKQQRPDGKVIAARVPVSVHCSLWPVSREVKIR